MGHGRKSTQTIKMFAHQNVCPPIPQSRSTLSHPMLCLIIHVPRSFKLFICVPMCFVGLGSGQIGLPHRCCILASSFMLNPSNSQTCKYVEQHNEHPTHEAEHKANPPISLGEPMHCAHLSLLGFTSPFYPILPIFLLVKRICPKSYFDFLFASMYTM